MTIWWYIKVFKSRADIILNLPIFANIMSKWSIFMVWKCRDLNAWSNKLEKSFLGIGFYKDELYIFYHNFSKSWHAKFFYRFTIWPVCPFRFVSSDYSLMDNLVLKTPSDFLYSISISVSIHVCGRGSLCGYIGTIRMFDSAHHAIDGGPLHLTSQGKKYQVLQRRRIW